MPHQDTSGCLVVLLKLLGSGRLLPTPDDVGALEVGPNLPYRTRDDFLSPAERSFYGVLVAAVAGRALVFAKVNLADVLFVSGKENRQSFRNKIDRKHVDFLLCTLDTVRPIAAIELDDRSHQRTERIDRDAFVDEAFRVANLPLLRFPAQHAYHVQEVASTIEPHLLNGPAPAPPSTPMKDDNIPVCRKCGITMVLRTTTKGGQAGRQFYGCSNYPCCRETVATT